MGSADKRPQANIFKNKGHTSWKSNGSERTLKASRDISYDLDPLLSRDKRINEKNQCSLTCCIIFVICRSNVTGGFPAAVANWTRKSCRLQSSFKRSACESAVAANQLDRGSEAANNPPHSNCPAEIS